MNNKFFLKLLILVFGLFFLGFQGVLAQTTDPNDLLVTFTPDPMFGEVNFMPGDNVSAWAQVINNSGQNKRIAVEAIDILNPDGFGDVLNLEIKEGTETLYNDALSKFFNEGEIYLSDLTGNGGQTQYDFIITFFSGTQNLFQGKSLGFDILIGFQGEEGGILPGAGSGGGGPLPPGLSIYNEAEETVTTASVTITWDTNYFSTSQVIYSAENESHILDLTDDTGTPPKYGYIYTTSETDISPNRVTNHSVIIYGLIPNTKYYYRAISHASPATIGKEQFFTTLVMVPTGEGEIPISGTSPTSADPGYISESDSETEPSAFPESTPGPSPDDSVEPSPASTVTEPEVAGFFPNLFAAAGSIFGNFWNTCYPCLPWWLILVFAGYCLLQGLLSKKKDKEKLVKWLILGICLAILAIIFYLVNYRCVAIWLLLLLVSLIFILWRLWIVSEKNLVWPEHKETENLLKKTKKDKVLLLGIIVLLILFIIYCILECLHPWVITTAFILFVLGVNLIKKKQK